MGDFLGACEWFGHFVKLASGPGALPVSITFWCPPETTLSSVLLAAYLLVNFIFFRYDFLLFLLSHITDFSACLQPVPSDEHMLDDSFLASVCPAVEGEDGQL